MKIGIFGGSFDPIHKGHLLVASEAIKLLDLDYLYFVPANKNPFKKDKSYASNLHRINMIKLAIKDNPKMQISEFETNRNCISYTIDTVKYFRNKFKDDDLYLLIGSDNLNSLHKWKDIDEIAKLVKIVIFKRQGYKSDINLKKYNCLLLNNEMFNFSSTEYKKGNFDMVSDEIQSYIGSNFLYFSDIARSFIKSNDRYAHLKYTASMAKQIAKVANPNDKDFIRRAYEGGYMHDITKEWSVTKANEFLVKYGIENLPFYKLHQNTTYYFLRDIYKYNNEEVLHAIKVHTTLDLELSLMDKIIYMADKLCKGRTFKGVQEIRNMLNKDFNECFKETILVCSINFNKEKGIEFSEDQKKIYDKWTK